MTFTIDLDRNGRRLVPNQSEHGKMLVSVRLGQIRLGFFFLWRKILELSATNLSIFEQGLSEVLLADPVVPGSHPVGVGLQ